MKRLILLIGLWMTLCMPSRAQKRAVICLRSDDPQQIVSAVTAFDKADIQFAMERKLRPDDSPQMKSALAMVQWKNNELVESLPELPSVEVVSVTPEILGSVISKALDEGWTVKTPSVWRKLLRDESRVYGGRCFYVSAQGSDDADGLSPATAWRTLQRVNDAVLGFADTVRFHAGEVFRGHLEPQSGAPGQRIVYTTFGAGDKPVLEPSWDASSPEDWVRVGSKLWKCEKPSQNELGNVILDHGKRGCAIKVDNPEQLGGKDLHFCWVRDEGTVYMVSRRNPGKRFRSIELAEKQHIVDETDCHDIIYDGLWLRYGSAHGIGGSGVKNITIRGCDISWIGGSTLYIDDGGRGVRYGNGIEFWSAAQDILVENCRIWECWDAALTNQSNVDGVVQKNITYRGNEIWNSEYSYEYWQQGDGARTQNIVFENNVCRDAGYGWGHKQRWNPNAAHLMFYDTTAETSGFVVRGNRFIRSKNCGMRLFNAWYACLTMTDNEWKIPFHPICRYHARPTSDLIYKYPDRLDRAHSDSQEEIESQTVEEPRVYGCGRKARRLFQEKFCSNIRQGLYDVREQVRADWIKSSGLDCLYDASPKAYAPAPRGYVPVYVSHYGRHGSRYPYTEKVYTILMDMLAEGFKNGNLTDYGQKLLAELERFWEKGQYKIGNLTPLGWQQQQEIATVMVASFPSAFGSGSRIDACSSASTRSIVSMSSFISGIARLSPKTEVYAHQGILDVQATRPNMDGVNPFRYTGPSYPFPYSETSEAFFLRKFPRYMDVLGRLFKDPAVCLGKYRPYDVFFHLYMLVAGMNSIPEEDRLDVAGIFTPEEFSILWETDNYERFREYSNYRTSCSSIVDDIIAKTEARLASGERGADLRFGHDHVVMSLLMIMDIDHFGHIPACPDDLVYWFQTFRSPMGANLQLVFYRPGKGEGGTLVKLLFNGEEARFGSLNTIAGPYYRWEDLRAYLNDRTALFVTR